MSKPNPLQSGRHSQDYHPAKKCHSTFHTNSNHSKPKLAQLSQSPTRSQHQNCSNLRIAECNIMKHNRPNSKCPHSKSIPSQDHRPQHSSRSNGKSVTCQVNLPNSQNPLFSSWDCCHCRVQSKRDADPSKKFKCAGHLQICIPVSSHPGSCFTAVASSKEVSNDVAILLINTNANAPSSSALQMLVIFS